MYISLKDNAYVYMYMHPFFFFFCFTPLSSIFQSLLLVPKLVFVLCNNASRSDVALTCRRFDNDISTTDIPWFLFITTPSA